MGPDARDAVAVNMTAAVVTFRGSATTGTLFQAGADVVERLELASPITLASSFSVSFWAEPHAGHDQVGSLLSKQFIVLPITMHMLLPITMHMLLPRALQALLPMLLDALLPMTLLALLPIPCASIFSILSSRNSAETG